MTRTQFVYSRHDALWAYDVALGIFLKHLIDAAESSAQAKTPWLRRWVRKWRLVACISDFGLALDRGWSELQRQTFIGLAEGACAQLAARESIPAEEIVGWPMLDDLRISPRGATEVETAPVIELGRAIITIMSEELPEPPEGKIWLYGTEKGRDTIGWRWS